MASRMLGSSIAALLQCGPLNTPPGAFLPYIFLVAAGSLFLPAYDYQVHCSSLLGKQGLNGDRGIQTCK